MTRAGRLTHRVRLWLVPLSIVLLAAVPAKAEQRSPQEPGGGYEASGTELSDLTLFNFFSEGWHQPWVKYERASGTPDMALLKVSTNFLERELRLDYARTVDVKKSRFRDTDFANGLVAYALDRRFMVEAVTNYQWNTPRTGAGVSGAGGAAIVRFQLIETQVFSDAFQIRVSEPNRSIGVTQTSVQYVWAGYNDLYPLGLYRTGLYYSAVYETLYGTHAKGARESDIAYDISLAKTWTPKPTPIIGNLTTFLEAFATTDLDGGNRGHTVFTMTPGVRFWFFPENSLMLGVDIPVSHPYSFDKVFRATYILNF